MEHDWAEPSFDLGHGMFKQTCQRCAFVTYSISPDVTHRVPDCTTTQAAMKAAQTREIHLRDGDSSLVIHADGYCEAFLSRDQDSNTPTPSAQWVDMLMMVISDPQCMAFVEKRQAQLVAEAEKEDEIPPTEHRN